MRSVKYQPFCSDLSRIPIDMFDDNYTTNTRVYIELLSCISNMLRVRETRFNIKMLPNI